MRKPTYDYDSSDAQELFRKANAAMDADASNWPGWQEPMEDFEDPVVYQNYSNHYGRDVRNYQNNYGQGEIPAQPAQPAAPAFQAYNADYAADTSKKSGKKVRPQQSRPSNMAQAAVRQSHGKSAARPERSHGRGCLIPVVVLLILVALIAAAWFLLVRPPKSDQPIGSRKPDTASILLCGVDYDGTRTDTMMLLYISGSEHKVNLVSLPRDTYTITAAGYGAKLNSAYGRNGTGEEGMEGLLDYVQDIIGYRPDGYVLVDFNMIIDVVDVMGGVDFDVPQSMNWDDENLDRQFVIEAGQQTLDGNDVLGVLRFRHGYYNQDLGRIEVQRGVIKACMEQWLKPANITNVGTVLDLFQQRSLSNLSTSNYIWMGLRIMSIGTGSLTTETLPGYATMIGDQSCYVLYPEEVAELINRAANPYVKPISADDLNIAQ